MSRSKPFPPQDVVKSVVTYDPDTGFFFNKKGERVGHKDQHGYMNIVINNEKFRAHRLAFVYMTGEQPPNCVDHINCDKTDNRWENLRNASYPLNAKNMPLRADNKSGVKGVSIHPRSGLYRARIQADGIQYYLGEFTSMKDAEEAIISARKTLHGEFGRHVGEEGSVSFHAEAQIKTAPKSQEIFMVVRDGKLTPSSWRAPETSLKNGSVIKVILSWEEPENDQ
jgi:hypothetical protein